MRDVGHRLSRRRTGITLSSISNKTARESSPPIYKLTIKVIILPFII
jgi:hypothetical protein